MKTTNKLPDWCEPLMAWFALAKRQMPWRDNPTPYAVLVSEYMLQQTQVATVIGYFQRFMKQFPTIQALANSSVDDVLKLWEGLGYYSRARHLHQCAQAICAQNNTAFPDSLEALLKLPGIGTYTAAAIASIAFGKKIPVVDGNVLRFWTRLHEDSASIDDQTTKRRIFDSLTEIIANVSSPSVFNQSMMELGALVCHPANPDCANCPLQAYCQSFAHHTAQSFPVRKKRQAIPHYHVAVGIIYDDDGRFLILQRGEQQMLGGLWEFPGGKLEKGETPRKACLREIKEETGLAVTVGKELAVIQHAYSHFKITMHAFACHLNIDSSPLTTDRPNHWITTDEIPCFTFPKANHKIFTAMQKHY